MHRTVATIVRMMVLAGLCAAASACAKAPAPPLADAPAQAPAQAPTEPVAAPGIPLGAPVVLAIRAGVAVGDTTLDADAEAPMAGDDVLTVPERGMAVVTWAEGPRAESLGAELALLNADGVRQLGIAQHSGTARFSIPSVDPSADPAAGGAISLAVETARATVRAVSGPADVIVSLDPARASAAAAASGSAAKPSTGQAAATADATLWVVVIDGAVEVTAERSVASAAGAAAPLKAALSAGQAIAIGPSAVSPAAMPVDLPGIETWYGGLVAGDGPPSVTTAAYRCQVTAPQVVLREQPASTAKAVAKSVALAAGAIIDVRGRSEDGDWLQALLVASELAGWVPAADMQCIAPTDVLAVVDPTTVHNVDRTALAANVPTEASFVQDKSEIAPGGCAKLNWDVVAGTQVTFDGQPVPGKGFKVMCPEVTTSYTVTWVDEAGRPQTRRLTVTVSAALAAAAAAAGGQGGTGGSGGSGNLAAGPTPVATICVGPECEVTVPPPPATATRRPRPTAAPAEPTDAPAPDPTDAPPPPVQPTDPPRPDPTDKPDDPTATPSSPDPTASPTPDPSGTPPTSEPPPTATPLPTETPEPTPTP